MFSSNKTNISVSYFIIFFLNRNTNIFYECNFLFIWFFEIIITRGIRLIIFYESQNIRFFFFIFKVTTKHKKTKCISSKQIKSMKWFLTSYFFRFFLYWSTKNMVSTNYIFSKLYTLTKITTFTSFSWTNLFWK